MLPWDRAAVDAITDIKIALAATGMPIGNIDIAITGHAIAVGAILVTNNPQELARVQGLTPGEWHK